MLFALRGEIVGRGLIFFVCIDVPLKALLHFPMDSSLEISTDAFRLGSDNATFTIAQEASLHIPSDEIIDHLSSLYLTS